MFGFAKNNKRFHPKSAFKALERKHRNKIDFLRSPHHMKFDLPEPKIPAQVLRHWRSQFKLRRCKALLSRVKINQQIKETYLNGDQITVEENEIKDVLVTESCFSRLYNNNSNEKTNFFSTEALDLNTSGIKVAEYEQVTDGFKEILPIVDNSNTLYRSDEQKMYTISTNTTPSPFFQIPVSLKHHININTYFEPFTLTKYNSVPFLIVLYQNKNYFVYENNTLTISNSFKSKNRIIVTRINEKLNVKRRVVLPIRIKQQFKSKNENSNCKIIYKSQTKDLPINSVLHIIENIKIEVNQIIRMCKWAELPFLDYFYQQDKNMLTKIFEGKKKKNNLGRFLRKKENSIEEKNNEERGNIDPIIADSKNSENQTEKVSGNLDKKSEKDFPSDKNTTTMTIRSQNLSNSEVIEKDTKSFLMDHKFTQLLAKNNILCKIGAVSHKDVVLDYICADFEEICRYRTGNNTNSADRNTIETYDFKDPNDLDDTFQYKRGIHQNIIEIELPFHFSLTADMPKLDQFFSKDVNAPFGAELSLFNKFYSLLTPKDLKGHLFYWIINTNLLSEQFKIFLILNNEAYVKKIIGTFKDCIVLRNMNILFVKNEIHSKIGGKTLRRFDTIYIHDEDNYFYCESDGKENDRIEDFDRNLTNDSSKKIRSVSLFSLPLNFLKSLLFEPENFDFKYFYELVKKKCDIIGILEIYSSWYIEKYENDGSEEQTEKTDELKDKIQEIGEDLNNKIMENSDELQINLPENYNRVITEDEEPTQIEDLEEMAITPSIDSLVKNIYALNGINFTDTQAFSKVLLCNTCKHPNILRILFIGGMYKVNKCRRCFGNWDKVEKTVFEHFAKNGKALKCNKWIRKFVEKLAD